MIFKTQSPQRGPNSSPHPEGAAPPPSTRGGGGVLLRPQDGLPDLLLLLRPAGPCGPAGRRRMDGVRVELRYEDVDS